ncbi:uncharacterized protein [Onthophagus taurus]|uniref:uncharacterized protein n=1 Tax=Onthophagus taurus TaxID=166361 RepID=UPI000C200267|nr:uncharacterized protein LOC111416375 [Onthophagus taurus]
MAFVKSLLVLVAVLLALVAGAPTPGGWGGHHEHHIIHVPYHVHTVHHTHLRNVVVPVPIVKKIYVHPHVDHHVHGGWW